MLVTTNNVSNQLRTRQHSSSYRHICLLPGISSALDEGDTTTYYDLLLLHIYRLADRSAGAEGGVGAASTSRAGVASTHPEPGADTGDYKTLITAASHC